MNLSALAAQYAQARPSRLHTILPSHPLSRRDHKPFCLAANQGVIPGIADLCIDAEIVTHRLNERPAKHAEAGVMVSPVERLKEPRHFSEMPRTTVVLAQSLPVRFRPVGAVKLCFPNRLVVFAFYLDRNGQPLHSLDLVPITPVPPGILHVVVEDEFIHRGEQIEISLSGDVV